MERFITSPNLPQTRVKHIIIGEKYRNILKATDFCDQYSVIWMPDNPFVDKRLSGHCDLSVIHTGDNSLILREYLRETVFSEKLISLGAELSYIDDPIIKEYPSDAGLNICMLGKCVIANQRVHSRQLVNNLTIDRKLIDVKQGYSRCSICAVNENAIITADRLIAEKARTSGIKTLYISEGFFELQGFDYGFIGGASFKLSNDTIAFTGSIDEHPMADDIKSFLKDNSVQIRSITNRRAFDIGSAIPLTEF